MPTRGERAVCVWAAAVLATVNLSAAIGPAFGGGTDDGPARARVISGAPTNTGSSQALRGRPVVSRATNSLALAGLATGGFAENRGQAPAGHKFVSHGRGYAMFLGPTGVVTAMAAGVRKQGKWEGPSGGKGISRVKMTLVGGAPDPNITGANRIAGAANYLLGNDPSRWTSNVSRFKEVRYDDVYPGIDQVFYMSKGGLEYDFFVSAGADPKQILIQFTGQRSIELDSKGNLIIGTASGDIRHHRPIIFQRIGDEKRRVAGAFRILDNGRVGFRIGKYDRTRTLVIDPRVSFSTYFGGEGNETANSVAVDASGNIYTAGSTSSPDIGGNRLSGGSDAIVTKFSPGGSPIWTTFLGGSGDDAARTIAVNDAGLSVAGVTSSPDFPVINGFGVALKGPADGFAAQMSLEATLTYSTYVGGTELSSGPLPLEAENHTDEVMGLVLGPNGRMYL
ncbi:MAG: SBBP repeat-containing protein, partial [Actinomycetota bacterium]